MRPLEVFINGPLLEAIYTEAIARGIEEADIDRIEEVLNWAIEVGLLVAEYGPETNGVTN